MMVSETEIKILEQLAQGNTDIQTIAQQLHRDISRIYRTKKTLTNKGFIEPTDGLLLPKKTTHVTILLQLLTKYPNIVPLLHSSGIIILTALLTPKTITELEKETHLKKSIIYKKIKQAADISAVIKKNTHDMESTKKSGST